MMPTLYMLVGLPASGKSTYAQELAEKYNAKVFSSDALREELFGDINEQSRDQELFVELHKRIKDCLKNNQNAIYDACNRSYKRRMAFLNELNKIPCKKVCIVMATPYEECIKQNEARDRTIPKGVIERMYRNFDIPYWYEGWDDIKIHYNKDYASYYGWSKEWLKSVMNYNQDNPHHTLTLGEHCNATYEYICKNNTTFPLRTSLRVAGMLHDCGKPFCKTFENKKGETTEIAHYYDHENVGSYNSLFYVVFGNPLDVAILIRLHMLPYIWEKDNNEKMHNKYKKLWGEKLYNDVMLLHEADRNAH